MHRAGARRLRSGATISAGLLRGLDRVSATRLSFLLGIPALLGAGLLGLKDATNNTTGATATAVATVVAFVVGYAAIAFLLRFVSTHPITAFVPYRVLLGRRSSRCSSWPSWSEDG